MTANQEKDAVRMVREEFDAAHIPVREVQVREFPGETIVIITVEASVFSQAVDLANTLDEKIIDGFITVRRAVGADRPAKTSTVKSINDPKVTQLIELLHERSRASEQQPSLAYVKSAAENINIVISKRHHLIFGRRGVGKTALMVEGKKLVEKKGAFTLWVNIQSMRSLDAHKAFLTVASHICDLPRQIHSRRSSPPMSVQRADMLKEDIQVNLRKSTDPQTIHILITELQNLLRLVGSESQTDVYIFLDDIHYLAMNELPRFLDMIHSATRDNAVWLKVAGIKHQMRWFTDGPAVGLQTGHDAAVINLDITLEEPAKAKKFLLKILRTYAETAGIGAISNFIANSALDRLVLASGGVPRDFLTLGGNAIQVARQRPAARITGVQDINEAAGRAMTTKLQELDEDAASVLGGAPARQKALKIVKEVLLEEQRTTYFRIDFQDKEVHPEEYNIMQSLMDLRVIHLVSASLSDKQKAGKRSEAYLLDLSQFSGKRFRRDLTVIDFTRGYMVLKRTGSSLRPTIGDTSRKLQDILRKGPEFALSKLSQSNH